MKRFSRLWICALMLALAFTAPAGHVSAAASPADLQQGVVTLVEPADGAVLWPPEVTFRWQPVEGADTYLLYYISEAQPEVQQHILVRDTQVTLELPPGVSYQWWVVSNLPILHGIPGPGAAETLPPVPPQPERRVLTVSETPLPPAPPRRLNPHAGGYDDRVRLEWMPSFRAERYVISRADPASGETTRLGETAQTAFDDLSAAAGQIYQYSVQACGSAGCSAPVAASGWVGACQPSLPTPQLISPPHGAQIRDALYTLEWSELPKIQSYEVQILDPNANQPLLQQITPGTTLPVMIGGSLSWRVRALDPVIGCPVGPWSAARSYRAGAPFPAVPAGPPSSTP